jgi:hypothetical protein
MLLDSLETPENREEIARRVPGESKGCLEWFERCLRSPGIK